MVKFVLASNSARRQKFLSELGYDFEVFAADIDESAKKAEHPRDYVKRVAIEKAQAVAKEKKDSDILSADTIVSIGRRIIGKAKNKEQAFEYIKMLSGSSHRVYSAVCLLQKNGEMKTKIVETRVKFHPMTNQFIQNYVDKEENWKGFAGAYAIQSTKGSSLVKSIVGSPSSVIGLPLYETECILKKLK